MIKKKQLDFIKTNLRYRKDWEEYSNYFIFLFPLAFFFLASIILYSLIKEGNNDFRLYLMGFMFLLISVLLFVFTTIRFSEVLTFECMNVANKINMNDFIDKIQTMFRLSSIQIDNDKKVIMAYTRMSFFSWGEVITIIFDSDRILINSRPTGINQVVTFYKDKQNIKKIKSIISNSMNIN